MNKTLLAIIPAVILAFASTQLLAGRPVAGDKFKPVCHKVTHPSKGKKGKKSAGKQPPRFILWVPNAAVKAHLAHGDELARENYLDFTDNPGNGRDKKTRGKGAFSKNDTFSLTCDPVPTFCGDGITQTPNDDGFYEECDEGDGSINDDGFGIIDDNNICTKECIKISEIP